MYYLSLDNFLRRFYINSGLIPGKAKITSGLITLITCFSKHSHSLRFKVVTFKPNFLLLSVERMTSFSFKKPANFFSLAAASFGQCVEHLILC